MTRTKLTPSQENYLEWVYRLAPEGPVQVSTLAGKLGVQLPSVSRAIKSLARLGLVEHQAYRSIHLTDKGIEVAEQILRRDRCLTALLVDVLGLPPKEAAREVHRLEHVISEDVLTRLEALVSFAASSDAWIKRLRLRIRASDRPASGSDEAALSVAVGESTVHAGVEEDS